MFSALKKSVNQNPLLVAGLLVTLLVYARFLTFGHISWDDPEMVFRNKAVRDFDLRALLTGHFVGNFIPLTMLVHALNWQLFGTHEGGHHAVNILIHLINGWLVFRIGLRLLRNTNIAQLGAIIFLLHPVQIESVGWISELKTLLSAFFSLCAILSYFNYSESKKQSDWLFSILLFVAACLSKSSAVVLPIALLCFDALLHQKFNLRLLLNKLPFLLLSLLFGIINIRTQTADLFINYSHAFPWHERIGFAGFALLRYTVLFFFPVNLSVIYPYPPNTLATMLTGYAFIALIASALGFLFFRGKKVVAVLVLFTLVQLALVLQFIPFGEVLYADRYMYLPVIGFGWILAALLTRINPSLRVAAGLLLVLLAGSSFARSQVWRSAITLYEDILRHFPNSFVALNSVGVEHMLHNNDEKALFYLNRSVQVSPGNYKGYYNRGLLYLKKNQAKEAVKSFDQAIAIYEYPKAIVGRGSAWHLLGDIAKARADAQRVLASDPRNENAHLILGNCYNDENKLDEALSEYNICIGLSEDEADYYFKRAIVFGKKQDFTLCLSDLNTCLELDPLHYEAYYWRGVAKVNLRQSPCDDLRIAAQENYKPAVDAFHRYCQ